ncbi:MAG: ABC transporter ATP-binding protein [Desulfatiglans sp.]|nr:ABC transporter ATP-binding protein [Thermodesulfobacteriota bacterium]MEE4351389.1 ABC transporter ATP-binding protein [Desulfatiglans sp.]
MENKKEVVLEVQNITLKFGGVTALSDVSFNVRNGEILGLIGPNGAGKSSLLNCINRFYNPQHGDIYYKGQRITNLSPYKITKLGIARVFQGVQLYAGLTALDNLMATRHIHMKRSLWWESFHFGPARRQEVEERRKVEEVIDFLEIESIRKKTVGSLPYGQRKRVDLGRALALEPEILLLDEPMAGMNLEEKEDIARFIVDISELREIPIVLVEHDMGVVMDICDRIVVLEFGVKIAEGTPEEIKRNPAVISAYLGSQEG